MRELRGHQHPVLCLTYAPDGRTLATGDQGGEVRLWDLAAGTSLSLREIPDVTAPGSRWQDDTVTDPGYLADDEPVLSLAFSPGGSILAVGLGKGVRIHHFDSWRRTTHPRYLGGSCLVTFVQGQDSLAWTGYLEQAIYVFDMDLPFFRPALRNYRSGILALAGGTTRPLVASGGGLPGQAELLLWDIDLESAPVPLLGHTLPVYAVAFAPGDRQLVSGSRDGSVRVWDVGSVPLWKVDEVKSTAVFSGQGTVLSAAFRPDGQAILAAYKSGRIVLLDAPTGRLQNTWNWQIGNVRCVAFAPDGMTAAAAGADHTVLVWDID